MSALRHRIRIRYSECDAQGIVFNAHYLNFFDIALTELWREAFGGYEQAVEEFGADVVVAEATVRFRTPIRFDDEVDLVLRIARLGGTSMTSAIAIERDCEVAAEGEIRHVYVDPETHRKREIPAGIRAGLEPYLLRTD